MLLRNFHALSQILTENEKKYKNAENEKSTKMKWV